MPMLITKDEFLALSPFERGYVVYWYGENPSQSNVPDEACPFEEASNEYKAWHHGNQTACLDAQDSEP